MSLAFSPINHNNTTSASINESLPDLASFSTRRSELTAWAFTTLIICSFGTVSNAAVLLAALQPGKVNSQANTVAVTSRRRPTVTPLIVHYVAVNLFMCLINLPVTVVMPVLLKLNGDSVTVPVCTYLHTVYVTCIDVVYWSDAGVTMLAKLYVVD